MRYSLTLFTALFAAPAWAQTNVDFQDLPRNVFNAWQLASLDVDERVQPTPAQINLLLPN